VFPEFFLSPLVIASAAASVDFRSSIDNDPSGLTAFAGAEPESGGQFLAHDFLHSLMLPGVTR
jgi:hypothetical protein